MTISTLIFRLTTMANSSSNGSSNGRSSSSTATSSRRSSGGSSSGSRSSRSSSGRGGSSRSSSSRSSRGGSSSGSRSSNSGFSLGRSVVGPIKRSNWTPYVLGAIGLGALIYGISQISAVRSFVSPSSSDFESGAYGSDFSSDMDDSIEFEEDVRVIGSDLNSVSRSM